MVCVAIMCGKMGVEAVFVQKFKRFSKRVLAEMALPHCLPINIFIQVHAAGLAVNRLIEIFYFNSLVSYV